MSSTAFCKPRQIARHLLIPERQLETEGDRLGMHAMGAADLHGPFVFTRLAAQHLHQVFDILIENRRGFFELNRQRRIHHIGRSHADMKIARIVADELRHRA